MAHGLAPLVQSKLEWRLSWISFDARRQVNHVDEEGIVQGLDDSGMEDAGRISGRKRNEMMSGKMIC